LKEDSSIEQFLKTNFAGDDNEDLRKAVRQFVSGYDTANPEDASAFALRTEWQNEDSGAQHRIKGGYGVLIKYLEDECKVNGGIVYLNSAVKEIQWQAGNVKAFTVDGGVYEAARVLIAMPLGVLKAGDNEKGAIKFTPPIAAQSNAIKAMGFGSVLKILLEFDTAFWEDQQTEALAGKSLKNMGYLFSEEEIPTWWTQIPQHNTVLTGWLGGPAAAAKRNMPEEEILQLSLRSLANIFKLGADALKDKLLSFNVVNWTAEPFTQGSYAYDTVATPAARKILNEPVADTLFFAGEYLYEGPAMGTVEAALTSGEEVAKRMAGY
jgi:monoamine oxidase